MKYLLICTLIMALASYLPRFVPLVFCKKQIQSKYIQSFLHYMPYAVLTALTFPAIFYCTGNVVVSCIVTAVSLALALTPIGIAANVVISVATALVLGFIFNI